MPARERPEDLLTPFVVSGDVVTVRPFADDDLALIEEASLDLEIARGTTIPVPFSVQEGAAFIERQHSRAASGFGWSMAIV